MRGYPVSQLKLIDGAHPRTYLISLSCTRRTVQVVTATMAGLVRRVHLTILSICPSFRTNHSDKSSRKVGLARTCPHFQSRLAACLQIVRSRCSFLECELRGPSRKRSKE